MFARGSYEYLWTQDEEAVKMLTASAGAKSQLAKPVQDLIRLIFDVESMKKAMVEFEVGSTEMEKSFDVFGFGCNFISFHRLTCRRCLWGNWVSDRSRVPIPSWMRSSRSVLSLVHLTHVYSLNGLFYANVKCFFCRLWRIALPNPWSSTCLIVSTHWYPTTSAWRNRHCWVTWTTYRYVLIVESLSAGVDVATVSLKRHTNAF